METIAYVEPTSLADAKVQLADIKLKKQELSLRKKELVEQQRVMKAEYTDKTRDRAMLGKGVGSIVSKRIDSAATTAKEYANARDRKALADELEPIEAERQAVQAQLDTLDMHKLKIDAWVAAEKAKTAK